MTLAAWLEKGFWLHVATSLYHLKKRYFTALHSLLLSSFLFFFFDLYQIGYHIAVRGLRGSDGLITLETAGSYQFSTLVLNNALLDGPIDLITITGTATLMSTVFSKSILLFSSPPPHFFLSVAILTLLALVLNGTSKIAGDNIFSHIENNGFLAIEGE